MATLSSKDAERRRLEAMALLEQGWSQAQVRRHFGVSPGAVSQWVAAYRQAGPEGLKARPHPGCPPKLSLSQKQRLPQLLLQGPRQHGFATELWTLPRIAQLIRKHFGQSYDQSGVWRILQELGWSCQKPERRARERDEAMVANWRQREWPRIKKRPKQR